MDAPGYWYAGTDEYLAVSYENAELRFVTLSETPGWRIAGTDPLDDAYIEAEFENKTCSGTDRWGLIFNSSKQSNYNQGYFFSNLPGFNTIISAPRLIRVQISPTAWAS